jgi:hypothetical protein
MIEPTHLVRRPGDRHALCGVNDPLPVCAVEYAPGHRYQHERCVACFEEAGLAYLIHNAPQTETLFDA